MRALGSLWVVLVCVTASAPAPAAGRARPARESKESKEAKEEAGTHFSKGIDFYKEGNYPAALAEFRAAYKAVPSYEVLFNIGLCERRLFKYGDSVKTLNQYLSDGGSAVPKDRREAVKKELDQIRALVAEVNFKVEGAPADVYVDNEKLGRSPIKEPLLLGPGKHTFRAEREGEEPDEKSLELVSATKLEVALAPHKKEVQPGELTIDSNPPGAVITMDGRLLGPAPVKESVPEGGHEVIAELEGYVTSRTEVLVTAGQARKVTVELETERTKRSLHFPLVGTIVFAVGGLTIGCGALLENSAAGNAKQVSALFQKGGSWDAKYAAIEGAGHDDQTWGVVLVVTGSLIAATGAVVALVTVLTADSGGGDESGFFFTPAPNGAYAGWGTRW